MSEKMLNAEQLKGVQHYNMSEDQIKQSKERDVTFDAGKIAGRKEILDKPLDKQDIVTLRHMEVSADKLKLTGELRKLFVDGILCYLEDSQNEDSLLWAEHGATKEQIIEFINIIPSLATYDVGGEKTISDEIIKAIVNKFPNTRFNTLQTLGSERKLWEEKIIKMGGKIQS